MFSPGRHAPSVRAVVAISATLTILVALALGWLGWRVVTQEQALEHQRHHERVEQIADRVTASVVRQLAEIEAALAQTKSRPAAAVADTTDVGPLYVRLERTGVDTDPANRLLYQPIVVSGAFDERDFVAADRLEFVERDDAQLSVVLRRIARTGDQYVRAEALLRLARMHIRQGRTSDALATYQELREVNLLSPKLEVPYAVIARFERCRMLLTEGLSDALTDELRDLRRQLRSGRWRMTRASFMYYDAEVRHMAGGRDADAATAAQFAIAEAVDGLWNDWLASNTEARRASHRIYRSERGSVLAVVSAMADRLDAVLFTPDAVEKLARHAVATQVGIGDLTVTVLGEHDEPISAANASAGDASAVRILEPGIPWRLSVSMPPVHDASAAARTRYLIVGLTCVMLIVAGACYAIARGVIREWQTARLQSDFVSAVSHEFRSPLTTLGQMTELLAERRILDESRRHKYFEVMQRETARLQRLVENLLDFGRMEANRRQYVLEPLDFAELVRVGVDEYQREVLQNGYEIRLSSTAEDVPVCGDKEALSRVVRNLLENAVKYSPDCRTVWVDATRQGGHAVLAVRDQGMGIPADEQPLIFDKFVRGESAKLACIQGTGIGLAMVKEVVQAHSGEVEVVSSAGAGSTFTVRLPLGATAAWSAA